MRFLVDTNVYLEFFLKREKYDSAMEFFSNALSRHNMIFMTAISMRDFGYLVHQCLHNAEKTKRYQLKAYEMTTKIISSTADAAINAIYSENKDFEDDLQMFAAEEAMCDVIITYNKRDFDNSKIPVFTPEEMLDIWKQSVKIV